MIALARDVKKVIDNVVGSYSFQIERNRIILNLNVNNIASARG